MRSLVPRPRAYGSTIAMAKEGGEVSDPEFRATFSLLPYVLRLSRVLSSGQTDPQATQKIVSIYTHSHPHDPPHSHLEA